MVNKDAGIRIRIIRRSDGLISGLISEGHAIGKAGVNPACTVVSATTRAFLRLTAKKAGMSVKGLATKPGKLELIVESIEPALQDWYKGLCDYLIQTLQDTANDYPDQINIEFNSLI